MLHLQAAVACAAIGVCVDLYCVCPSPLGLQVLEPLPAGTGQMLILEGMGYITIVFPANQVTQHFC